MIELMIAITVSTLIFYASYLIVSSSSDAYQVTTGQLELQFQARKAASVLVGDLRQSSPSNILGSGGWSSSAAGSTINLTNNQAIVYSSAHDLNGDFITDTIDHTPIWQSIVVCAPYITPQFNQLRRYRIFGAYDFPVSITNISAGTITVQDASGAVVNISRSNGAPGMLDVLANDFGQVTLVGGDTIDITLNMNSVSPRGHNFSWDLNTNATARNQ